MPDFLGPLAVRELAAGPGPPVLGLHGVTANGAALAPLFREPPGRRVLACDLRGHGESPWTPPWTLEQHIEDVREALAALEPPVALVGHSFGGLVALHVAVAAPERVSALVLLDPAIGVARESAEAAATEMGRGFGWPSLEEARTGYASLLEEGTLAEGMAWFDAFRVVEADGSVFVPFSGEAVAAAWRAMAEPLPPLGGVAAPVLIVQAARGSALTAAVRNRLATGLPSVELAILQAGHDLPWEVPDAAGALVRRGLAAGVG